MAQKSVPESVPTTGQLAQRGSLITIKKAIPGASEYVLVVSNDIQNESSEYLLVVPLQRRLSRLKAPFAVDLGREAGLRELHVARCDWTTRVPQSDIKQIIRAAMPPQFMTEVSEALKVSLGI